MKKRIRNKIYKRATSKLDHCKKDNDKRTYIQIEKDCSALSFLEKKVFYRVQERYSIITDRIIEELRKDGKW